MILIGGVRREGETIPLHDHPNMHGIIKCLEGKIRVTSFTRKVEIRVLGSAVCPDPDLDGSGFMLKIVQFANQ